MDLAVLQKLGGWLCLGTLQVYVQVRKEPAEEIITMEQFLGMKDLDDASGMQSAG
jgi:hypothetical protein